MTTFDAIKAINQTAFESKEKHRAYEGFRKRIDRIVRRKPTHDHSMSYYMNALRQHKENSN